MRERDDEGQYAWREQEFSDFADAAMRHARRLHSTLIEEEGAFDAQLEALTRTALADLELLAALGTSASTLTEHAPVPFAPALHTWLAQRAHTMSPLLRHTLAADATPTGFTGAFGRLAGTLAAHATGTDVPRTGLRLPLPPQWEQHATPRSSRPSWGPRLPMRGSPVLSSATTRPTGSSTRCAPGSRISCRPAPRARGARDRALLEAFFGDTDTLDCLVVHVTA
ncbi:hypothetical protein [Streptomyces werraensis]|uniref:hypothetical protein n=1 Tax=Streptomyces werraensis TaxID=68284 RepID=UPI00382C7777